MDDDHARSSRRHHILGSINPDSERRRTRSRSRSRSRSKSPGRRRRRRGDVDDSDARKRPPVGTATTAEAGEDTEPAEDAVPVPRAKRLRLKDESWRRHRARPRNSRAHSRSRSRSRSPSSRRRRRRHDDGRRRSPGRPDPHETPPIDADAAFRESLLDAMADDEGAAYWQGVYGQPIHQYGGELENMNEDEYAAHVRRRMWERTREGMLEAAELAEAERVREARRRRRRQRAEAEAAAAAAEPAGPRCGHDGARLSREVGESLARGRERQRRRDAQRAWDEYADAWEGAAGPEVAIVVWPGPGGRDGISEDALRSFYYGGLEAGGEDDGVARAELVARLRGERLRWHPDKMQQRLGGRVDQDVMQDITAVFQIVDRLWGEVRPRRE